MNTITIIGNYMKQFSGVESVFFPEITISEINLSDPTYQKLVAQRSDIGAAYWKIGNYSWTSAFRNNQKQVFLKTK